MKFPLVESINDELMTREEAEELADEEARNNPQAEYIWYGQKLRGNYRPVFHYPESRTAEEINNLRNQYGDIYAIRNPYGEQ